MTRPIRWLFRIALGLSIVGIVVVVAAILSLDTIVRDLLTSRMRAATGMEVKISSVHIGLLSPTMTIEGLQLYNTPAFGGSLCLDMPELHVEYDRAAMRSGTIHLHLVRLNLARINVVEDKQGRSNFEAIQKDGKQSAAHTNSVDEFKFGGIDTLNLSLGKLHVSNLRSGQEEEVDFGVTNQILHNVKSEADLTGVAVLMSMRASSSGGHSGVDLNQLLKDLTSH
ncbi:MAG TPA: hypothetical protein VMR33_14905 [Candidatus Baltobacteraceae bacterium]|jgi:uncharacterized protein involved in outer membrane biogenesis|nr:hypothetical protein [Candidatus Baltobacteraceae bacterium]